MTLGPAVSDRVTALFDAGELAEGYILDQVASFAADELAQIAGHRFHADSASAGSGRPAVQPGLLWVARFGPGALFATLRPDEIGISLNDSCLMHPIKSVSGVLVLAPVGGA